MKKLSVKLRYNTECTDNHLYWRVLIDGKEHLASHVHFNIPVTTTQDFLADKNVTKHHISCESESLSWEGDVLIVG